jgi:flavin-dependent dehydrogenase
MGWNVTLIDQHRFPRNKVCGECLSSVATGVLRRLGLDAAVRSAGAVVLEHVLLHPARGRSVDVPLPQPMWGVSRLVLDGILLHSAEEAGATVRELVRCEAVEPGPPATLRLRELSSNRVVQMHASWVLIADGKDGAPLRRRRTTGDLGIKAHFVGVNGARDGIELFGFDGHYAGLAPIEQERWNLAVSVPAEHVKQHAGVLDAIFDRMIGENRAFARHMSGARRVGPWLASPLPRYAVRGAWPAGVVPIGNAAGAIEPIGGEGMGLAMRSAELAVDAIASGETTPDLERSYRRLWRSRRVGCRVAALIMSAPWLATAATRLLEANEYLAHAALAATGKLAALTAPV